MKEKALVAWMFRHDMVGRWQEVRPQGEYLLEKMGERARLFNVQNFRSNKGHGYTSLLKWSHYYLGKLSVPQCDLTLGNPPVFQFTTVSLTQYLLSQGNNALISGANKVRMTLGVSGCLVSIQQCITQTGLMNKRATETRYIGSWLWWCASVMDHHWAQL